MGPKELPEETVIIVELGVFFKDIFRIADISAHAHSYIHRQASIKTQRKIRSERRSVCPRFKPFVTFSLRIMTEQSALLLRKQLAGNTSSWVDKANKSDVPEAIGGGFFEATLSSVYAIYK